MQTIIPYLFFNGNASDVIAFYETTLGAKAESVLRYGEVPGATPGAPNAHHVMHACLKFGNASVMISDGTPGDPSTFGDAAQLAINFDEAAEMETKFAAMSAGGKVVMAIHDTFWGAKFGMLVDKFGVHWMFNCEGVKA